jgi:hypothetical protein
MIRRTHTIFALIAFGALSQQPGLAQAMLQQRLGEVEQSMAQNKARLSQYAWTETTEISLKGDVKKRDQNSCQYGPDGKVQKTPIGAAPPAEASGGRLKRRIVAHKTDELTDYMERVKSLMGRYIPPSVQAMQAAFHSGKATLKPGAGALVFGDYAKPGDQVTLTFDLATKKLVSFEVATYLDQPKDVVTMNARFSSLPDGTNFVEQSVLNATAKQIQVTTTSSGYSKLQ